MNIRKALLTIQGYCEKHISCDKCQFHNDNLYCLFTEDNIPSDWDIDEMLKKRRGEQDGNR